MPATGLIISAAATGRARRDQHESTPLAEIEAFAGDDPGIDALFAAVAAAPAMDRRLGEMAENLCLGPPDIRVPAIDGASPIVSARGHTA